MSISFSVLLFQKFDMSIIFTIIFWSKFYVSIIFRLFFGQNPKRLIYQFFSKSLFRLFSEIRHINYLDNYFWVKIGHVNYFFDFFRLFSEI